MKVEKTFMKTLLKTWKTLSKLATLALKVLSLTKTPLKSKFLLNHKHYLKEKEQEDLLPLKVLKMNPLGLEASLIASLLMNLTSIIDLNKWILGLIILSIAWIIWNMISINSMLIIIFNAHGLLLFLFSRSSRWQ